VISSDFFKSISSHFFKSISNSYEFPNSGDVENIQEDDKQCVDHKLLSNLSKNQYFRELDEGIGISTSGTSIDQLILRVPSRNGKPDVSKYLKNLLDIKIRKDDEYFNLTFSVYNIVRSTTISEIYDVLFLLFKSHMPQILNSTIIAKSIEYPIDLALNFDENSSLLRMLKGILSARYNGYKSFSIEDSSFYEFTAYSFKAKFDWNLQKVKTLVKFQIYNKSRDVARVSKIDISNFIPTTRFEFTVLNSTSEFSEKTLFSYKEMYRLFLNSISPTEFNRFEEVASETLFDIFCQKKANLPRLEVTSFIVIYYRFFLTEGIFKRFYQLLYQGKFIKSPYRIYKHKFFKKKVADIVKFTSLVELNQLIFELTSQLS